MHVFRQARQQHLRPDQRHQRDAPMRAGHLPQGLHSKCSPTPLPLQIKHRSDVLICALTHARAGMYQALTVSVSLTLFVI